MDFKIENFKKVMDAIRANPKAWAQDIWHGVEDPKARNIVVCGDGATRQMREPEEGECGTVHCVAGWAQILAGHDPVVKMASTQGGDWLGLDGRYNNPWIFRPFRTWEQLEAVERGELDPMHGHYTELGRKQELARIAGDMQRG